MAHRGVIKSGAALSTRCVHRMRWLQECIYSSWNEYNGGLSEVGCCSTSQLTRFQDDVTFAVARDVHVLAYPRAHPSGFSRDSTVNNTWFFCLTSMCLTPMEMGPFMHWGKNWPYVRMTRLHRPTMFLKPFEDWSGAYVFQLSQELFWS